MAIRRGLEPLTSAVTGRRSNQLNYRTKLELMAGFGPATSSLPRMCATTCATSAFVSTPLLRNVEVPPRIELGIKVLQTSALPLGYGTVFQTSKAGIDLQGAPYRLCLWSGLRGSNPLPQPWQGCALPNELNPHHQKNLPLPQTQRKAYPALRFAFWLGASGRNRTNDTRIFSPLLYQLSYRGI